MERALTIGAMVTAAFVIVVGIAAGDVLLTTSGSVLALLLGLGALLHRRTKTPGEVLPIDDDLRTDLLATRSDHGDVAAIRQLRRRRPGMSLLDAKHAVDAL